MADNKTDINWIPIPPPGSKTKGDVGFNPPNESQAAMDFCAWSAYKVYTVDCKMKHEEARDILGLSEDEMSSLKTQYEGEDDDE